MRFHELKILLGGLAVILALGACSTVSPALPTIATFPATAAVTASAPTLPATAVPTVAATTNTATPVPATAAPSQPALPVVAAPSIQSLSMLDPNNGWALTDTGVVRTTDGGSTWYNATPAGLNGSPANPFFLNANTAWLAAANGGDPTTGMLYHTSDGGSTWSNTTVPFGGGSLHFIDAMQGWDLVGLNAGMSHEAVAIFHTSDGGATWTRILVNDPSVAGSTDSLPLAGDKNGITVLDSTHAWVTGTQPSSDFIYIYASQDGGTSWAHQDLSVPSAYKGAMTGANLPVFFGNQAVLPVLLFANSNGSEFYVSHDSGQTWSATTAVGQGGFLSVASANDFFVWDGSTPLNVSHDAGATWTTVTPNVNIKDNMVSMQFVNASTGWAVTSDANSHAMLYKSVDGGATWTVLIQ